MSEKYVVTIYEQPYQYQVMADSEEEAEEKAIIEHNGGSYDDIGQVEVKKADAVDED
jgi:hypothetical protein